MRALAGGGATAALFAALMIALFQFGSGRTDQVVLIFLAYLMVVLSLQIFTGNSGVISFGQVALMAVGAYTGDAHEPEPGHRSRRRSARLRGSSSTRTSRSCRRR